jgi:hypothetical protein
MNRFGTAFRVIFHLPVVWIALVVVALTIAINNSAPFADIVRYAIQRLFY